MIEYKTIVADPPWLERGGGKCKRGADRHYPLMDKKDIAKTMRESGIQIAADSHLWLWATSNYLKDALWVMEVLSFVYKTSAVWVKLNPELVGLDGVGEADTAITVANRNIQIGLGQYMRHAHEWLLFGTRGKANVPPPEMRQPSVIFAQRTKHSRKPEEAYRLIECTSSGPYLEMFARESDRKDWNFFGNEIQQKT